jgi:hypothetical protein
MSLPFDNLAGAPLRVSAEVRANDPHRRIYDGFIKVRLAHSEGRSYLVPELLVAVAGTRYFLPSFFGPPQFAFGVDEGLHVVRFDMDAGSPRAKDAARLVVQVRSRDRVRTYDDGAQLYRCRFQGPPSITRHASGFARRMADGDFALRLFHHTTPERAGMIRASRELWSSPWNLAGTRELRNVAYSYFATLPTVVSEADLRHIAMSSSGAIEMQTTSDRQLEEVLVLPVYRGDTRGRTASVPLWVPTALVSPPPLRLHPLTRRNPAYYEVVGPEIVRVGLVPGGKLRLEGDQVAAAPGDLKRFSYVVLGNAATRDGLAAPYEEEETKSIAHLQALAGEDAFGFWLRNQNTDQVTGRAIEPKIVAPARDGLLTKNSRRAGLIRSAQPSARETNTRR